MFVLKNPSSKIVGYSYVECATSTCHNVDEISVHRKFSPYFHALEAKWLKTSPRKCVSCISALWTIEQTGDSSTSLRMTCFAITIDETLSPHLRPYCHPEEALSARQTGARLKTSPRKCISCVSALWTIEQTGDSSTPLRMTRFAITIDETLSPHLRPYCHPEEALSARHAGARLKTSPRRCGYCISAFRTIEKTGILRLRSE